MGIQSEGTAAVVRATLRIFALLTFSCGQLHAGTTNQVQVGLVPFVNQTGETNLDAWCKCFPDRLQFSLEESTPRTLIVYFNKVLTELTNNAWDGRQAPSDELIGKVARKLQLQKIISGSFNRDQKGWELQVRIGEPGVDARGQVLTFKNASTQNLLSSMSEQMCRIFGVVPHKAFLDLSKKYPVSNGAMDKVAALSRAQESGVSNEVVIAQLRSVLAFEPDYPNARMALMDTLFEAGKQEEALAEARKLVELAPQMCWGYIGMALGLRGPNTDEPREKACLQAFEAHPGCPSSAGILFPIWASDSRWKELKPVAEKAHAALPKEAISTAALAAALGGQGDRESAWKLVKELGPLDEDESPNTHAVLLLAALGAMSMDALSRELLWLQRRGATNDFVRELVSQMDATFWLRYPPERLPTNPPPRLYSPAELKAELAKRLSPAELALAEDPLRVTDQLAAEARTMTAGLTNPTAKAAVLFASVIEERLKTEQQATNSPNAGPLPVCHQYASRLVALARSVGLHAWLVHVEFVSEQGSGYHDRAAIRINDGQIFQFDPTLATLGDVDDKYRILDDGQAIAHHLLQSDDLAKVRIAQKLDPDDLWTRIVAVVKLSMLNHVDEAEALWKALPPSCTNRWDYYLSRARIELDRGQNSAGLDWLRRAESLSTNNPTVLYALGMTYGSLNNHAKAAEYLERAIKLGAAHRDAAAKADLESTLKFTRGMARAGDMTEKELREQMAAGDLTAQMMLIKTLFRRGDNEEGMKLLLDGAQKGDAFCQENYARNLLVSSRGAAAAEAVVWLRKAALQAHPAPCYLLAKLLYEGTDVPRNETEAAQWAHLGSAQGDKDCRSLVEEMRLFIDSAAFAEGQKRAQALLSKKGG